MCPFKTGMLAFISNSLECDLLCKQGHCRCNIKMRSWYNGGLIEYDWCPYKRGEFGDRHAHGKMAWEDEARDQADTSTN